VTAAILFHGKTVISHNNKTNSGGNSNSNQSHLSAGSTSSRICIVLLENYRSNTVYRAIKLYQTMVYVARDGTVGGSKTPGRWISDFFNSIYQFFALFFASILNPPKVDAVSSNVRTVLFFLFPVLSVVVLLLWSLTILHIYFMSCPVIPNDRGEHMLNATGVVRTRAAAAAKN